MILAEMPAEIGDHPLAGLAPEQRGDMRAQAFGRVLAAIATRKTESARSGDAPENTRQVYADPKPPTEGA